VTRAVDDCFCCHLIYRIVTGKYYESFNYSNCEWVLIQIRRRYCSDLFPSMLLTYNFVLFEPKPSTLRMLPSKGDDPPTWTYVTKYSAMEMKQTGGPCASNNVTDEKDTTWSVGQTLSSHKQNVYQSFS
jgi:hypothetical protein